MDNFSNCIGAIDGKHIQVHYPLHTGSHYYDYKKYFSACHGSPEADGGSTGSCVGLSVWLRQEAESKEPLALTLNHRKGA